MRLRLTVLALLGLFTAAQPAAAQTRRDSITMVMMVSTPYGALPLMVTPGMTSRKAPKDDRFELRYGRFTFGKVQTQAFAIGGRFGALGISIGAETCRDCSLTMMAGADYDAPVVSYLLPGSATPALFTVRLRPAVGFARPMSSVGVTIVSAAVDVPFAIAFPVGEAQQARLVPFVAPGFGGASAGGDGHHDSGMRGSLAFGVGLVDLVPGSTLSLGARQILLESARITFGLGLTLGY